MTHDPKKHHRRSIRLSGYDYSKNGTYFITICTRNKECMFGTIVDGAMRLNDIGRIAADSWEWLARQYDYIVLDEWVIMPNHIHGIIVITNDVVGAVGPVGAVRCTGGSRTAPAGGIAHTGGTAPTGHRKPIGRLIGAYKTVSTKRINELVHTPGTRFWQRNYYEHIIRNDDKLNHIRQYIIDNPARWQTDRENPNAENPETATRETTPTIAGAKHPYTDRRWLL
jgi:putative transposase